MNKRTSIKEALKEQFGTILDIRTEKENETETINLLKQDVEFVHVKLWVLICAILIASLGLNVNSTAVIIGAMLISPLMGPIIGFGLGLGIYDSQLIKKSLKHFLIATFFGIVTSAIYFLITPINDAQSELLARTQPNIYDVLIAFAGGVAGILASTTRSKGNVIPGVAIATALIPPLCTAGYGLANGQMNFFFGAIYLYLINSVFIALATYLIVGILHFPKKEFVDKSREKRVKRMIVLFVVCTIIPSVFLTYNMLKETVFQKQANNFISSELSFPETQIFSKKITKHKKSHSIEILLIGKEVNEQLINNAKYKMAEYGLQNTELILRQGFGESEPNIEGIRSSIMKDMYSNATNMLLHQGQLLDSLRTIVNKSKRDKQLTQELTPEMKILFPSVKSQSITDAYIMNSDSMKQDTVLLVYLRVEKEFSKKEREMFLNWIKTRVKRNEIKLITENN